MKQWIMKVRLILQKFSFIHYIGFHLIRFISETFGLDASK